MNGPTDPKDIRHAEPQGRRRGNFRRGWHDVTERGIKYKPRTLKQLTWQNLGNRLGTLLGYASEEMIDEAFTWCKRQYQAKLAEQNQSGAPDRRSRPGA